MNCKNKKRRGTRGRRREQGEHHLSCHKLDKTRVNVSNRMHTDARKLEREMQTRMCENSSSPIGRPPTCSTLHKFAFSCLIFFCHVLLILTVPQSVTVCSPFSLSSVR